MTSYDDTKWWIESFRNAIKHSYDQDELAKIFAPSRSFNDITKSSKKEIWIKKILEKIDKDFSEFEKKKIMVNCSHVYPVNLYKNIIQRFKANHDLDESLQLRNNMLVRIYENEWKKQLPTIDAITFDTLKNNFIYETGIRDGNSIQVRKIPGNPVQYNNSTSENDKKFYYCHCPWIRELIKKNIEIPAFFCYCGAGQYKVFWENVTEHEVDVDIVKSIAKGNDFCEFKITIDKII